MRRNHWAEKGNTGPQLSLSLTILRSQVFALNCQIYLNLILGGLQQWAAGRSSQEEKSLLKNLTRLRGNGRSDVSENGVCRRSFIVWPEGSHSHIWMMFISRVSAFHSAAAAPGRSCSQDVQSRARPWISDSPHQCWCLSGDDLGRDHTHQPARVIRLNHSSPTSSSMAMMILHIGISERAQERCQHQHRPSEWEVQTFVFTYESESGPTSRSRKSHQLQ